jgi:ABC-type Fe3+/spermidine/putrescine transport system ATPase subunit
VARLRIDSVVKRFGGCVAVDGVSLDIASGEFVTLVGASGCGKTTLLRLIAGFTRPDSGEIWIGERRVDDVPLRKRNIGFVFQSYALFPTMTVAGNIGFALRLRCRPRAEVEARVAELCALTRLEGMEDRYPHELSGGQQQRVALARALAPRPTILLLDEPLSALDAKIRAHLRDEVRAVVKELGITTVYVTHDQEEALSMSDRVAVMDGGRFLQVGRPMDVYARPAGVFVANFIGTSNRLDGQVVDGIVRIDGLAVPMPAADCIDGACVVCLRPEHVRLASAPPDAAPWARAEVDAFAFLGQGVRVTARLADGTRLLADMPTERWLGLGLQPGDAVLWSVDSDAVLVFPGTDAGTATA